jgi:non-lysosomal glucosylceramidase
MQAFVEMCKITQDTETESQFKTIVEKAKKNYVDKLWNSQGEYFNYDTHSDVIMADQMAGQWYSVACGLGGIVNSELCSKALTRVFEFNVMKFKQGTMGAVNGMKNNGQVDISSVQSSEVWTGTCYAVAACMVQHVKICNFF